MQTNEQKNPLISEDIQITLVPKRKRNRIWEIDFLRGLCVILMILDHLAILLGSYFGYQWYGYNFARRGVGDAFTTFCYNWVNGSASQIRDVIHPVVLFVFFSISGISCTFSRNNAKRGFQLLIVALIYTFGSYVAQYLLGIGSVFVAFGVLDFLAVSMLIYALLSFVTKDNRWAMVCAAVLLIVVTLCLYFCYTPPATTPKIFAIVFPPYDFYGNPSLFYSQGDFSPGDLFTLVPYTAFYFAGVLFGELFYYERISLVRFELTKSLYKKVCDALYSNVESEKQSLRNFCADTLTFALGAGKVATKVAKAIEKAVCFFGKHALIVYVVHVVLLAAILSLISGLFITPGDFGI